MRNISLFSFALSSSSFHDGSLSVFIPLLKVARSYPKYKHSDALFLLILFSQTQAFSTA